MIKEKIIEKLKGNDIVVGYEWLKEFDEVTLNHIYESDIWSVRPAKENILVRLYFNDSGVDVYATIKNTKHILYNSDVWFSDVYDDYTIDELTAYINRVELQ